MSSFGEDDVINILNKILGKYPKNQLSANNYPLDMLNSSIANVSNILNNGIKVTDFPTTLSVSVNNFPSLQDVLITNTTLTVSVSNIPSLQDVDVKNTTNSFITNFPNTQDVDVINTTNVFVTNFPATQDVKITNTTDSYITNFPSILNTAPQNTQLTLTQDTLSTTATTATQMTATATSTNLLIITNTSTTDSVYLGFNSASQPYPLSPSGIFSYDDSIRQISINSIYLKSPSGIHIAYTYA